MLVNSFRLMRIFHLVVVGDEGADDGVAGLVVRHQLLNLGRLRRAGSDL